METGESRPESRYLLRERVKHRAPTSTTLAAHTSELLKSHVAPPKEAEGSTGIDTAGAHLAQHAAHTQVIPQRQHHLDEGGEHVRHRPESAPDRLLRLTARRAAPAARCPGANARGLAPAGAGVTHRNASPRVSSRYRFFMQVLLGRRCRWSRLTPGDSVRRRYRAPPSGSPRLGGHTRRRCHGPADLAEARDAV